MSRYIDADKLCKGLKDMAKYQEPYKQSTILGVVSTIENAPTADVVEVVRCKDCKHWNNEGYDPILESAWGECQKSFDDYHCCETTEDDYCSYGEKERKEI